MLFSSERNNRHLKVALIIAFAMILFVSAISSVCVFAEENDDADAEYTSFEDLKGKRIASQTGTIYEIFINEKIPDAEIVFFSTFPDQVNALKDSDISITVEYTELEDHTKITIEYPDKYKPVLDEKDLSSKLLKAKTETIEYEFDEKTGSRITVVFK